jgi:hypothetical protein
MDSPNARSAARDFAASANQRSSISQTLRRMKRTRPSATRTCECMPPRTKEKRSICSRSSRRTTTTTATSSQWARSSIPANYAGCAVRLALDCAQRHVLGEGVRDPQHRLGTKPTRASGRTRIVRHRYREWAAAGGRSGRRADQNQFPRASTNRAPAARSRAPGLQSAALHDSRLPRNAPRTCAPDLQEAMDVGIAQFGAGRRTPRDEVLRAANDKHD